MKVRLHIQMLTKKRVLLSNVFKKDPYSKLITFTNPLKEFPSFFQMADNPWDVNSMEAFTFLKCPECSFDTKEEDFFQIHAVDNHPLSFVLFGDTCKDEKFDIDNDEAEHHIKHFEAEISESMIIKEDKIEAELSKRTKIGSSLNY